MKEVGLRVGVTAQRVDRVLKKAGIETRKYTRSKRLLAARKEKRKVLPKRLLIKFYKDERRSVSEILERLNTTHYLLYQSLEFHNIPKRKAEGWGCDLR